ncbi:hypothetical protein FZEAL_2644 [Fusarium zealandicum]|uniref:AMP-dependent synthetase/ligase domain-containing protein n=1 Tax=Fusarium zealandicum TaxID=1053134 RepID=A0A8H4UQN0_9HYPO|nr:hypothetical protein FZEAL_2644 [Fusarium zealandicum]
MAPTKPDNIGKRLLPSLVDEIAATDPDRVFYSVLKTDNPEDGFQDINAKVFSQAVDRCSWHIEKHLGRGQNFPTLAYLGPQDAVYAILVLASIKTGYKLLLLSPRNTIEASQSLLDKTDCNTFLLPPVFPMPIVGQLVQAIQMNVVEIPGLHHWLEGEQPEPYPYNKTFEEAKSEPFVVLHTSGSTGLPKPLVQTHGTLAALDAFTELPSLGYKATYPAMCSGTRLYLAFPLCHCAGLSMLLPGCIYVGFTVVLARFPPSAEAVDKVHVYGNVQQSCLPPNTLVDLANNPKYLDNLGRLEQVTFGGGSLPKAAGDAISARTKLLNCLGTTECGVLPVQLCDREDWEYLSFSPTLGHEFRHVSEDIYEHFIVRKPELAQYQGIFETFPELDEWSMKDLYTKHPTKEDCWLHQGRTDDIIIFSTGEKLNPIGMENIISTNLIVTAALVVGSGRPQSSLLVETMTPPTTDTERNKILDAIWPNIERANKASTSKRHIHRNMVIFTSSDKPMSRAGKGTVQRKLTLDAYSSELEALYKAAEGSAHDPNSEWVNGAQ